MLIIIGLGNPIPRYQGTRHNFGQAAISYFQKIKNFPEFKLKRKFESLISEGNIEKEKIILALPQTFMNESGRAVKKLIENCKLKIENLLVIHDDLDLPLGKIRIRKNGSAAGHKGVESIIDNLGTDNFIRFRLGISRPTQPPVFKNRQLIKMFVLKKFRPAEKKIVHKIIQKIGQTLEFALKEGIERAISLKIN